jgi:hypothetical protein
VGRRARWRTLRMLVSLMIVDEREREEVGGQGEVAGVDRDEIVAKDDGSAVT